MELVSPSLSPILQGDILANSASPLMTNQDPILPSVWPPMKYPEPVPKDLTVSVNSALDTDRGFGQLDPHDPNLTLITPSDISTSQDSLPIVMPQEVADSLCTLGSSGNDVSLDYSDLEPLFDFS